MPTFYFHLHECGTLVADEEGRELADLAAARAAAVKDARGIMASEVERGTLCLSCRIEVTDGEGRAVLVVRFSEAVEITGI